MKRLGVGVFGLAVLASLAGCSNQSNQKVQNIEAVGAIENASGPAIIPEGLNGEVIDVATGKNGTATIGENIQTTVYNRGGKLFFVSEGVLTNEAFLALGQSAESKEASFKLLVEELKASQAVILTALPSVGYFKALLPYDQNLFSTVEKKDFSFRFVLNPILYQPGLVNEIKEFSKEMNAEIGGIDLSRTSTDAFSGLARIKAPEFVNLVKRDIGGAVAIDGSNVKVGITDTGITYNHPTFGSAVTPSKNRITYMKEFTGEGTMYFNSAAKFSFKDGATADQVLVTGDVIVTPSLPEIPVADDFVTLKDVALKVTADQKAWIVANAANIRFGVLLEKVFSTDAEPTDINGNGKKDDQFPALFLIGATEADSKILVDFTAKRDFTRAVTIGDFNSTGDLANVKSEKIGFHIAKKALSTKSGGPALLFTAGIVGFDPGNHGTHVAGIASGLKTIATDTAATLARGVAPESSIMMNRVCANAAGCSASEAIIDLAENGAEVINMSLGGLSPFNDGYSSQDVLVNRLTQLHNTTFVISAGNSGPGKQTVGSPSVARLSLSVGASASRELIRRQYQWNGGGATTPAADDDFMLFFSSRGPTANGGFKPSVSAPGTELSSIQLNSPEGVRAGLDIYWGTSMAAPTATGAYALLLDGVKKYNDRFPTNKLPSDAKTLREVLISSARPFDVSRFDPETGAKLTGQYTWIDQGTGMIDLVAAWNELKRIRDDSLPTREGDVGTSLDYQVITSFSNPNGIAYDGSRLNSRREGIFGGGVYLSAGDTYKLVPVHVSRKLPINVAAADDGTLARKLVTSAEEFTLKTVYYGSDKPWLKVGVRNQVDCMSSETAPLTVLGRGVEIAYDATGKASINASNAGTLNLCVDRLKIRNELSPGDHGALIFAYATQGGKIAPVPSFIVPVYLNVPHQVLEGSTGYEITKTVRGFGVDRNYVQIPAGTGLVKVTLEVPEAKPVLDRFGKVAEYTQCSGIELMSLEGVNTAKSFAARAAARVKSCELDGNKSRDSARTLTFTRVAPTAGVWDLHVFGQYQYSESGYKLRVDYVNAQPSVAKIEGLVPALNGTLDFNIVSASFPITMARGLSSYELTGLRNEVKTKVANKSQLIVKSPLGELRAYPAGTQSVVITTAGSPGNDIDLAVIGCPAGVTSPSDPRCQVVGSSGGAADDERVQFTPVPNAVYAVRVDGYEVKDQGNFVSTESISLGKELGTLSISGSGSIFKVDYAFADLAKSALLNSPLFTSKQCSVTGAISLKGDDDSVIGAVPVEITSGDGSAP